MKPDHRGRTGRHSARQRKPGQIVGQFIAHPRDLIESPAWAALTLAARRMLDRIELEHLAHGGKENGRLKVTHQDFADFGIRRASVPEALRLLQKAGLVVIEEPGRGGNAEFRRPHGFRLTYLRTPKADPGDEWRRYTPDPLPTRDIESGPENEPEPVAPKTSPKIIPVRRENGAETRRENGAGILNLLRVKDA